MAKSNFRDIVPPDRRSIKRIPVPERKREAIPEHDLELEEDEVETPKPRPRRKTRKSTVQTGRNWGRIIFTLVALVIIIGIGFWFVTRASGATIKITPHQTPISVNSTFMAAKTGTDLSFQTVTIAKNGSLSVPANGQETVTIKASGTIIVYNTTGADQKLIAGTRFATSDGLIFRIPNPITVPAGIGATPGSVSTLVTADDVGTKYNVGVQDFTIPGFEGSPKYKQFYGRTDPQHPIAGGFSGTRPKVADADVQTAKAKIDTELKSNLIAEAQKDIPSGFIMPENAYYIEYATLPATASDTSAEVNEQATFHGFIFPEAALANALYKLSSGDDSNAATNLETSANLLFSLKSPATSSPWLAQAISFNLNGTTTLLGIVDTDKLKTDLIGKPRKSLNAILAGYPSVEKAEVTIRPFWKENFPTDPNLITIELTTPELSP